MSPSKSMRTYPPQIKQFGVLQGSVISCKLICIDTIAQFERIHFFSKIPHHNNS